jgi:hypothetical protein
MRLLQQNCLRPIRQTTKQTFSFIPNYITRKGNVLHIIQIEYNKTHKFVKKQKSHWDSDNMNGAKDIQKREPNDLKKNHTQSIQRRDNRCGYRPRQLDTRMRAVQLMVLKLQIRKYTLTDCKHNLIDFFKSKHIDKILMKTLIRSKFWMKSGGQHIFLSCGNNVPI